MTEDILNRDRFYVDLENEEVIWLYLDRGAAGRDRFVRNRFGPELLRTAVSRYPGSPDEAFGLIGEHCRQYLSDAGTEAYEWDRELFGSRPSAAGLTAETLERLQLMFRARELIGKYCMAEFGTPADFSDPERIGLAYSATPDGAHDVSVYANLVRHRTEICLDSELIGTQESPSLKGYVEKLLPDLDFNELTDIPDWVVDEFLQTGQYRPGLEYMQLDSPFGPVTVCLEAARYACGGGLALQLCAMEDGQPEPWSSLTVNLPEYGCAEGCAFVDTNHVPDAPDLIREYRLGTPTGRTGESGWCRYPEYAFDPDELQKHCLNPEMFRDFREPQKERNDAR